VELNGFRELLLKKAEDNPTLKTLITYMRDDLIADHVLESLEKMARPHASMGRFANAGVTSWANQMKNKDVEMLRDALSHHVSHYKSALKNGKRNVADAHLNKIIPLMHLAAKAAGHSGGQLGFDYVPTEPWESNYTTLEKRPETGKLKEGTKGLGRRPKKTDRTTNERGVPDYKYLEMAPHPGHPDQKRSPHSSGYPFEEIQIGNPAKIDANEGYLHINDVGPQESYVGHPFDTHPIHSVADVKQDSLNPEKMQQFANAMNHWHAGEHSKNWMQSMKESHGKDPEAFKARGKVKPEHHYEGIKLGEQPDHVKSFAAQAPAAAAPSAQAPVAPAIPEHIMAGLPAALRAKIQGGK
jgi:hypothetical protein